MEVIFSNLITGIMIIVAYSLGLRNRQKLDNNEKINVVPDIKQGIEKIKSLYEAQKLVNTLVFDYKLNIIFLKAVINDDVVVLHGVSDSAAVAEKAITIVSGLVPEKKVESCISIVQDFKAYP